MRKTGFIAIVGLANAGKSTLLNSLIGQKVSIVSPKPQTTRDNILGIWTDDDSQIVFVDTPGHLQAKNKLGDHMLHSIDTAVVDVDAIMVVIDGHEGISDKALEQIDRYTVMKKPVVVVITKTDITQPDKLMPHLGKLNDKPVKDIFCVSARKNRNIDELKASLKQYLTSTTMFYEEDDVTNRSTRYMVQEIIREKVLLCCNKEIPHGVAVQLNKYEFNADTQQWDIDANIIIERQSHKPIILGKQGSMIKTIGTMARQSICKLIDARVHLELWVRVQKDWRDNQYMINQLGYNDFD